MMEKVEEMKAKDIMAAPVVTIGPKATVGEAAQKMLDNKISCLPVVNEEGRLVGMLTHSDFGLHRKFMPLADNLYTLFGSWASPETIEQAVKAVSSKSVESVMVHPVVTVGEDDSIAKVAEVMAHKGVNRVPVMRDHQVIGIITRHDLLKLIGSQRLVIPDTDDEEDEEKESQ